MPGDFAASYGVSVKRPAWVGPWTGVGSGGEFYCGGVRSFGRLVVYCLVFLVHVQSWLFSCLFIRW